MTTTFGTSNLRTSSRQTRTNPTRSSKMVGSSLRQNPLNGNAPAPAPTAQEHGFYPAITHFTDAITALPREFRRHTSLLKEVDAKAWAPEAHLQTLLTACVTSTPSEIPSTTDPSFAVSDSNTQLGNTTALRKPVVDNASQASTQSHHDLQSFEQRRLFYNLRGTLSELMVSMDEKNHLINGANEDLSRHLKRLTTIFPHVADEISEEARLGSLTHWAYIENKQPARANAASSRREAAAAGLAAMHDTEIASRSESRREAMLARRQRQNQLDSDFDDARTTKRANINGKPRRVGDMAAESLPGLGISGVTPVVKRKRAEKAAAGGIVMERSLSGVFGGRASSREPVPQDAPKKRKAPAIPNAAARKRINTANSATNSPKIASSPLVSTFGKEAARNSPIPGSGRPHYRGRQNSTQGRPPSSASNKNNTNGTSVPASTPELHKASAVIGKAADETRNTRKDSLHQKGDRWNAEGATTSVNGTSGMSGGTMPERTGSRGGANLKREEAATVDDNLLSKTKSVASPRLPPPATIKMDANVSRPEREREREREPRPSRARSSKTSTPIVNSFAEADSTARDQNHRPDHKPKRQTSLSSRPGRNRDPLQDSLSPSGLPLKRSHKKGAGLAAQAAALLAAKLGKQMSKKPDMAAASSTGNDIDTSHSPSVPHHNALRSSSRKNSASSSSPQIHPITTTTNNDGTMPPHHHPAPSTSRKPSPILPATSQALSPGNLSSPSASDHNASAKVNANTNSATVAAAAADEAEDEPLDSSGEEPRYCYCQQVSYGEMVACDAEDCAREWFHLECVGLGRAPGKNQRWFCEQCESRLKNLSSGGNSNAGGSAVVGGNTMTGGSAGVVGGVGAVVGGGTGSGNGTGTGSGTGSGTGTGTGIGIGTGIGTVTGTGIGTGSGIGSGAGIGTGIGIGIGTGVVVNGNGTGNGIGGVGVGVGVGGRRGR